MEVRFADERENIKNEYGAKVRLIRRTIGLTQEELAQMWGSSLPRIQRWESERNTPDPIYRERRKNICSSFSSC